MSGMAGGRIGPGRLGVTVLVFAALGPPIGAVALSLLLPLFIVATALTGNPNPVGPRFSAASGMVLPALAGSYAAGLPSAAATGLLFAVQQWFIRRPGVFWAVPPALAVWLLFLAIGPSRDLLEALLLLPVHVVPALGCAWLALRLTRKETAVRSPRLVDRRGRPWGEAPAADAGGVQEQLPIWFALVAGLVVYAGALAGGFAGVAARFTLLPAIRCVPATARRATVRPLRRALES